jgi:hypothetical protein
MIIHLRIFYVCLVTWYFFSCETLHAMNTDVIGRLMNAAAYGSGQKVFKPSLLLQARKFVYYLYLDCFTVCYNHPKIFLSTTAMALFLFTVKQSIITRHDLQKFKKGCSTIAQNQLRDFLKTNKRNLKNLYKKITADFDNSEKTLTSIQTLLDHNQQNLDQMPEAVETSLSHLDKQEQNLIQEIFNSSERRLQPHITQLETYHQTSNHTQELLYMALLAQLREHADNAETTFETPLQRLMQNLAREHESLNILMHQYTHQEHLQLTRFQDSMAVETQTLHARFDALINVLSHLVDQEKDYKPD